MKMKFYVLSKLLSNTTTFLYAGYIAFALSTLSILLKGWHQLDLYLLILVSFTLIFVHHYLSFRVKFDADLLIILADQLDEKDNKNAEQLLQITEKFDNSLDYFKLIAKDKIGRNWEIRFKGCLFLLKIQIILLILQYLVLIVLLFKLLTQ